MPQHARTRDPRTIITPDAFEVSDDLLGMPLAPPSKRLVAIVIDLAVIGLITVVTESFSLVLGVIAAVLFIRAGIKRTPVKGSAFNRAMRLSVGCLGVVIAGITIAVGGAIGIGKHGGGPKVGVLSDEGPTTEVGLSTFLSGLGTVRDLRSARTDSEAEEAIRTLVRRGEGIGMTASDLRDFVTSVAPSDAPWAANADAIVNRVLGEDRGAGPDSVANATLARALEDSVVADTFTKLQEHVQDLESVNNRRQLEVRQAQQQLAEATSGGLFNWLKGVVDDLGFGFGWATVYMTIFLSWWKGQTVGKRLMGIRVLRLDGEPITWWTAFERAGGYAAGFATGLLGFAQVIWDANRQAIHDRIVGTVVVLDGAEKVGNWREAL
jgi:uncharacterized RDD family membrane protein YckC